MKLAVWTLALAACGRIGFDGRGDGSAASDAVSADAGPLEQGLLLHLAFDSDGLLVDRARHHAATCTQCPTTAPGRVGDGAARLASNACVTVADPGDLEPAQLTIAAWVAPATAQFATIIGKTFHGDTGMSDSIELSQENSPDSWSVYFVGGTVGTAAQLGAWHHLAAVVGAAEVTLYIDGTAVGSTPNTSLMYTSEPFRIGCDLNNNALSSFFQGDLDDIRLYDHALAPADLAALLALN